MEGDFFWVTGKTQSIIKGILMTFYKSDRIIDGKPKKVIVDEYGDIIENPTEEQIKTAMNDIRTYRRKGKKCCICNKAYKNPLDIQNRYYDDKGKWDRKSYMCRKCYMHMYTYGSSSDENIADTRFEYNKRKRYLFFNGRICCNCKKTDTYIRGDIPVWGLCECSKIDCTKWLCNKCVPNIHIILRKLMAKSRNNQLSKDSPRGKGFIGEQLFCTVRGSENYNLKLDNFNSGVDVIDIEYGIVQIKTPSFYIENKSWHAIIGMEHNFDTLVIICMSSDFENVERVYIIPASADGLYGETQITIYEDFSNTRITSKHEWVEKYRIDKNAYGIVYQTVKLENYNVLK